MLLVVSFSVLELLQLPHGIEPQELLDSHVASADSDDELSIENSDGDLLRAKGVGAFSNPNGLLPTMAEGSLSCVHMAFVAQFRAMDFSFDPLGDAELVVCGGYVVGVVEYSFRVMGLRFRFRVV